MLKHIMIDLEMNKIKKQYRDDKKLANELIEIGAVKMDENYDVIDSYKSYVKPDIGIIDTNIEMLTGIRKNMVQNAPGIRKVLENFAEWFPDDVQFVTWSENDEIQIKREIEAKHLEFEGKDKYYGEWYDCQKTFSEIMNDTKPYKLEEALNLSDVDYDIHLHDGLVDAANTALLFKKMKTEKEYKFNTYYIESKKEPEMLTSTLGELFGGIKLA